jgi:SAM-dependent methyltransferase
MTSSDESDGYEWEHRPFYREFAWAYNLLIERPVSQECAAIAAWFAERGVGVGASVLDAGCGTGRYAFELARRGYAVEGVDSSPDFIRLAAAAQPADAPQVSFRLLNLLELPRRRYNGVLCRGVLNDVDEHHRQSVFDIFSDALQGSGVVVVDVREWNATVRRITQNSVFRKSVETSQGALMFSSVTTLDHANHRMLLAEHHSIVKDGQVRSVDVQCQMYCWTEAELFRVLREAGFRNILYFGAYDPDVRIGTTDRIVAVASLDS